jgi:hypothetical protein
MFDIYHDSINGRIKNGEFLHAPPPEKEYKCNSHHYRCPEFSTIDWANSAVIFGCSNVFGVGVSEEDTLSNQLSRMIDMPVINMGIGSTSMEFSFYNSMILNNSHPTPKAVINLWTGSDRTTYYHTNMIYHKGSWCNRDPYMDAYNENENHSRVHALFFQMISKNIWVPKTKYFEASFFNHTANILGVHSPFWVDTGWDNLHPGPKTLYNLAVKIKEELWT